MSKIYKITNKINNMSYIGKTENTIEKRFKQHIRDSRKEKNKDRKLYADMNKYGIEFFEVELLEDCLTEEASEREIFYIKLYGTYRNGYNMTIGGDGTTYIDRKKVIDEYYKLLNITEVSKKLGHSTKSISKILKDNNIDIKRHQDISKEKLSKKVSQFDLNNNFIRTFNSIKEAAIFNNIGDDSKITKVCKGKRKTAYGYIWKYA